MNPEEDGFLRSILTSPDDRSTRLIYADWVEERGDPRAEFLRLDPGLERINVPWLDRDDLEQAYLDQVPEIRRLVEGRQATRDLRKRLRELRTKIDPTWLAFMESLGCPFHPFFFCACETNELPFAEQLGIRGTVVTFESAFRNEKTWDPGLMDDLVFLSQLKLRDCAYGAASCQVYPFVCEQKKRSGLLTGADILASLKARNFQSRHIRTLAAPQIPFPGYHPSGGHGIDNDEIHNDFAGQYVFQKENDEEDDESDWLNDQSEELEFRGTHGQLKRFVADRQLWYVVLHTTPQQVEGMHFSRYVILFAVGKSKNGDRLLGVVTHQVCHNLCD